MTVEEIIKLGEWFKTSGLTHFKADGIELGNGSPQVKLATSVPESKPEDIVTPLSVLDEYSDDEILYWATPFFDEIQANKQRQVETGE